MTFLRGTHFYCACAVLLLFVDVAICFKLKIFNHLSKMEKSDAEAKSRSKRQADINFGKNYLANYGYVPPDALVSADGVARQRSWRKGLREMQEFFGLEPTGDLDEETLSLMHKPRCANADKVSIVTNLRRKKRYVKVGSKWQTQLITYSINSYTPKLGKKLTHEAIDDAFAVWAKHTPLQFKKVSPSEHPDIVTLFAEGYHNDNTAFDGVGGYLAHAYYPGQGIGGDTHFDGAEPWTLHQAAYEGNDLFLVAVHELGHALGLGHSPDERAIMAPIYKYHDTKQFELPQDDIYGIQSIYGVRYSRPEKPIVPTTTTTTTSVPASTTIFYPWRTKRPTRTPPTRPTTLAPKTTTEPPLPDICKLKNYDAISYLRHELYVFSGIYMWRRRLHDDTMQGPYKITSFWPQLTEGVNAVFENPSTNRIVFFKDHLYYEYDGTTLQSNSPRTVRFLGLQNDHVGAAVWWERNGKTYFFQDSNYWRFSGTRVEKDYPRSIDVWDGIPPNVDAAFSGVNEDGRNHTYFVKGNKYWKFNNWEIKVVSGPMSFRRDWLRCGSTKDKKSETAEQGGNPSTAIVTTCVLAAVLLVAAVVYVMWRRQRTLKQTPQTRVVVGSPSTLYSSGSAANSAGNSTSRSGEKTMCVTAAQQRLRWFRFSLQGRV